MALKQFKPRTPGTRQLVLVDRTELHKGDPVKALTEGLKKSGGRNSATADGKTSACGSAASRMAPGGPACACGWAGSRRRRRR